MITKTIDAVVENGEITANVIQYRVFGILVYKKTLIMPNEEIGDWSAYIYRF